MKKNYSVKKIFSSLMLLFVLSVGWNSASAGLFPFTATYSGAQEVPANASTATGTITGVYNDATNTIFYMITFSGLAANVTAAHFHGPAAPGVAVGVQIGHAGFPTGVTAGTYFKSDVLTDAQEAQLMAGLWYSNIHNATYPGGEIRAQIILDPASPLVYSFSRTYSGANENPPNASPATGTIVGAYNSITNTIFYTINFSGLTANTIAAHFHSPATPGVNAGVIIAHAGFPVGVTSGSLSRADVFTDAQEINLLNGKTYSNIHTTVLPGGELRTQIFFDAPFVAPVITCPSNFTVSTDPGVCTRSLSFSASATGDPAAEIIYRIGTNVISSPHTFAKGTTTVSAMAINGGGFSTCSFTVTVNDNEPPVISNLGASPDKLWPPNHKMKDVVVSYTATDNCPGTVNCQLSVSSNEPENGTGDGDTGPDWMVVDKNNVKLRAERAGNGSGRVYTISVTCTDANGNTKVSETQVTVPRNMSPTVVNNSIVLRETGAEEGLSVLVFPNPSRSQFTLYVHSLNTDDLISFKIYDITGRMVDNRNLNAGVQSFKVGSALQAGVYVAEFTQGNEKKTIRLLKLE